MLLGIGMCLFSLKDVAKTKQTCILKRICVLKTSIFLSPRHPHIF